DHAALKHSRPGHRSDRVRRSPLMGRLVNLATALSTRPERADGHVGPGTRSSSRRQPARRPLVKRPAIFWLALLAAPLAAHAQPAPGVHRIGWLSGYAVDEPFRQGLRTLGYVEGQNLVIEARFHRRQRDRFPALAAELVALRVPLIVCPSTD